MSSVRTQKRPKMGMGKSIKKYRVKNGLSQNDLAQELGVTQGRISQWESGATPPDDMAEQLVRMGAICPENEYKDSPEKWFTPEEIEFISKNYNQLNIIGVAKALGAEYVKVLAMVSKIKEEMLPMYDPKNGEIEVGEIFHHKGYRVVLVRKLNDVGVFFDQESATAFRAPLSFANKADGVRHRKIVEGSILSRRMQGHLSINRTTRFALLKGTNVKVNQLKDFEDGISAGSEMLIKVLAETFGVDTRTILHWARTEA